MSKSARLMATAELSTFLIIKWQSTHIAPFYGSVPLSILQSPLYCIFLLKMSHHPSKSFSSHVPKLKQSPLTSFNQQGFEECGISSLLRITEPQSATPSQSSKSSFNWPVSQTPSISSLRRIDGTKGDRLKLKDYLHLNSIEKKSKKSSSTSKSELEQTTSIEFRKNQSSISSTQTSKNMQSTILSQPNIPAPTADPTQILKEDILKRIQTQTKQLSDLARYIKEGFNVHQSESRAQFMLFNVLNSVINASKGYQQIGEQINQYEKCEETNKEKGKAYYWEESNRALESPAKMLKKGLELTFNLAQFLQGRK